MNYKKLLISGLTWLLSLIALANSEIDSLEVQLNRLSDDRSKVEFCFDQFKKLQRNKPEVAIHFLKIGDDISHNLNDAYFDQMVISLYGQYYSRIGKKDSAEFYYLQMVDLINSNLLQVEKGPVCTNIGNHYRKKSMYDSAFKYGKLALSWYHNQNDLAGTAKAHNNIGIVFRKITGLDSALYHYKKCVDIIDQIESPTFATRSSQAITLMNIGIVYTQLGLYDKALEFFLKSVRVKEEIKDYNGLARSYINLGVLYSSMNDEATCREYNFKAMQMAIEMQLFEGLGQVYNNIGNSFARQGQFDSALFYHEKALENRKTYGNKRHIALSKNNVGNVYRDLGQYDKAIEYHREALSTREALQDQYGIATSNQNLGLVYKYQGMMSEALPYLLRADSIAEKARILNELEEIKLALSEIYAAVGQFESAYHFRAQAAIIRDSINNQEINRKIYEIEKKHSVQKAEEYIAEQGEQIQAQKYLLFGGVLIIVLLGVAVYFAISRARNKSQMLRVVNEKNTKIETLMRELHHRVKNNLQVISSLLGLQSMKLSDPIAKEAIEEGKNRVKAMSMIHQRLYKDRDIAEIDFDDYATDLIQELKNTYQPTGSVRLDLNIPKVNFDVDTTLPLGLVLNELITNSFKYAFHDIEKPIIKVELLNQDQKYKLIISDNGPGITNKIDFNQVQSFGLKLVNILVNQLKGSIQTSSHNGLSYEIEFRVG